MKEKLNKILIYFKPLRSYWRASCNKNLAVIPGIEGCYPLNIIDRLCAGHYRCFDAQGIPANNNGIYNYTTVCSYALANWEAYLKTGDENRLKTFLQMADFLLSKSDLSEPGNLYLWDEAANRLSAMYQGEAMSVFVRAWGHTKKEIFLEAAQKSMMPLTRKIGDKGVLGKISANGVLWYEERCNPPSRHILNGMIYTLWGLRDVMAVCANPLAKELWEQGIDSVAKSLDLFDTGFWSRYWVPEDDLEYVASMMYHNLHVIQLEQLSAQSGNKNLKEYATIFESYAKLPLNRIKAIKGIWKGKRKLQLELLEA